MQETKNIFYNCSIFVEVDQKKKFLKLKNISEVSEYSYRVPLIKGLSACVTDRPIV